MAVPKEQRYQVEGLEQRFLLSTSAIDTLGLLGANQTGAVPTAGVVVDANGNVFGTTQYGGPYGDGTVYEISKGSPAITTLAIFDGNNGANPYAAMVLDADGNLYGTTSAGGDSNQGTIFKVTVNNSTVATLASFGSGDSNGSGYLGGYRVEPGGQLTFDGSGNLFGTTSGGTGGNGVIFEIPHGGSHLLTLAQFHGSGAAGNIAVDGEGNVFGTTENGNGTIFELPAGSGSIITLASFDGTNGANPTSGVALDSAGNLFGTTAPGTYNAFGTVFELVSGSTTISTLASFNSAAGTPVGPIVIDGTGNILGATASGGVSNSGTVFELARGSGAITTLASFGNSGAVPRGGISADKSGNVYGTTSGPWTNSFGTGAGGTIFQLPRGGSALVTLASFNPTNGVGPYQQGGLAGVGSGSRQGLAVDSAGNFYCATLSGGPTNNGAIFEVRAGSSSAATLAAFNGADGSHPEQIDIDANGNLVGLTTYGGANGFGTLFRILAGSSVIGTLASFDSNLGSPIAMAVDGNGNIYALTDSGGSPAYHIVEVPFGSSAFKTLAVIPSNFGQASSVLAVDGTGDLFGTDMSGPGLDQIFELAHGSSAVTQLAPVISGNIVSLTADTLGDIFGAIYQGGAYSCGSTFELPRGRLSIDLLASFDGFNGQGPTGDITLSSDGTLYGTTEYGGTWDDGTVFQNKGTIITTLASFDGVNGQIPECGAVVAAGGTIYGTTTFGGSGKFYGDLQSSRTLAVVPGTGTIFKLVPFQVANSLTASATDTSVILSESADRSNVDWVMGNAFGMVPIDDPTGLTIIGNTGDITITLDYSSGDPLPSALHLSGTFTIENLPQAASANPFPGTSLDLSRASAVYLSDAEMTYDPLAAIKGYLQNGYNAGMWTGAPTATTGVITSADAAANPTQLAIGYADSADPNSPDTVPNTIELKTTVIGDTNLDGTVNLADLLALTRNFGHTNASWDQGDFNYDGSVNLSDFLALARNFGKTDVVNPLLVTSTADDGSLGTLRYAIAHSNPGDTISFSPGVFAAGSSHVITLATGQLEINHNLTIAGPGAANLSISGNNASRVFQVDAGVTANLSGLTIANGNAGAGNAGGGVSNSGTINLSSVVITANAAGFGAGIYTQGVANLTDCTLSNNSASTNGGGIDTHTSATLIGCTVNGNRTASGSGGGVLDNGGTVTLINDTITANSDAGGSGGGVANVQNGTLTIANCTIAANAASNAGGGIYLASGSVTINNTVVAGDTYLNSSTPNDVSGTLAGSYNLIGDGSGGLSSANHNLLGKTSSLLDPKLGVLSNNGGPTLTMLPQTGSPLIDAGGNALVPTGIATDQRGYVRIAGGTVDIGACEFGSTTSATVVSSGVIQSTTPPARRLSARRI